MNYYTLERLANDRGYEPGNVKWIPYFEQCLNRRAPVLRVEKKTELTSGPKTTAAYMPRGAKGSG